MMKRVVIVLLLALTQPLLANELKSSSSSYLAMHGDDPVDWLHLDKENLDTARKADKLIYISSGYFSCHWCHVMQRESYQNRKIARKLNKNFTPFKIDRELHPVVDAHLIRFIEQARGYAGWPLNVFLTPEGYPVFATTYATPEEFDAMLERLNGFWQEDPDRVRNIAESANREINAQLIQGNQAISVNPEELRKAFLEDIDKVASRMEGGFGNGSKFPSVPQLEALLSMGEEEEFLLTTLDAMNTLHLQDHIHGGFFRYTTDPDWQTPHFEKMLYDNAQLATLYLRAGSQYARDDYLETGLRTLKFMQKQMKSEPGGYVSSLSAIDRDDIEGGNYLWSSDEVKDLLEPRDFALVKALWRMDQPSRFDDGFLPESLYLAPPAQWLQLKHAYGVLSQARIDAGDTPPVDDKRLSGWNGLVLTAYATCLEHTQQEWCRTAGKKQADFLNSLYQDGKLIQGVDRNGQSLGPGTLEDYALVIRGLHDWQQVNKGKQQQQIINELLKQALERFYNEQGWLSSEQPLLPGLQAMQHLPDTVMPSPSAIMIERGLPKNARITGIVNSNPYSHASLISLTNKETMGSEKVE
jgi:uncharacterized protein YyaL (SSP411 family)